MMKLAEEKNLSVNKHAESVEETSARMTEDYLGERARRGDKARFERALAKVADVEPDAQDRL